MTSSGWSESFVLAEWAEQGCRHFDLIASWEMLLVAYEVLGFVDSISDDVRLSEFKQVVTELNKFLTRMKTGLARTKEIEDAIVFLGSHINTPNMNEVRTRPNIAYNKLKQRWLAQAISTLETFVVKKPTEEGERDV